MLSTTSDPEGTFSALRRLKTSVSWRLNNCLLLHYLKSITNTFNNVDTAKKFVFENELREIFPGLQLFRHRLCHKSVNAYATMPIGIMGYNSLTLLGQGSWRSTRRKEKASIHLFVLFISLTLKHLEFQLNNCKTPVTHNTFGHCRVRFYVFVRQHFSNRLYTSRGMRLA